MEFIAEVILRNKFITKLSFEDNYFTDEAAEVFLKLLQKAEHLSMTEFTIHSNYISEIKLQQIDLFMRTHARELQKKKRENKRQRSQSNVGVGNDAREESKMSAGRQSSGSLSRSTSRTLPGNGKPEHNQQSHGYIAPDKQLGSLARLDAVVTVLPPATNPECATAGERYCCGMVCQTRRISVITILKIGFTCPAEKD
ncbi:unnamed protein product [Durusdinium trenchii]|uniref:Uncharacterized protein n=1 Tax=Durusdinium trenchii TaxID=1381693 RepID=A0ABP0LJ51_9DINO